MACGEGLVWLLLLGHLLGFGVLLVLLHCPGHGLKLLKKLFWVMVHIELAACFEQDWVLRSQALGDGMLQDVLSFENMR